MRFSRLFVFLLLIFPSLCNADEFKYASIEGLFEQKVGEIVLPKIYQKLGLNISIISMPGKRAQMEAIMGRKDGEIMRIWTYGIENPNMVRVPTSYYHLETMAFAHKESQIKLISKADLGKYNVLKVRGVKHTNNITQGLTHIYDFNNTQDMFMALGQKKTSLALTNTADGLYMIKKLGLTHIVPLRPALANLELYHYIHPAVIEANPNLLPKLDAAIQAMKQSGELAVLLRQAEQQVLARLP
jgi:polar amino acid transport system substrate-binding protein